MKAMDTLPQVRPTSAVMTALPVIFKTSPPDQPEVLVWPNNHVCSTFWKTLGAFDTMHLAVTFYQCAFSFSQWGMAASVSTVI